MWAIRMRWARPGPAIRALAPLKGVIHAAGVLDDGVALRQSWERTWAVLAPKVLGSWALHQQTASDPLDWLVLCSSAAGLLGAPGQSGYAAANTWLDGLAALRQGQGAVGVSIAWGPWAAGGMQTRRPRAGLGTISTAAGIEALAAVAPGPPPGWLCCRSTRRRRNQREPCRLCLAHWLMGAGCGATAISRRHRRSCSSLPRPRPPGGPNCCANTSEKKW